MYKSCMEELWWSKGTISGIRREFREVGILGGGHQRWAGRAAREPRGSQAGSTTGGSSPTARIWQLKHCYHQGLREKISLLWSYEDIFFFKKRAEKYPTIPPAFVHTIIQKPKIISIKKSCNWVWTVYFGPRSKTGAPASNLVALLKFPKSLNRAKSKITPLTPERCIYSYTVYVLIHVLRYHYFATVEIWWNKRILFI